MATKLSPVQQAAAALADAFERATRPDGSTFCRCKDGTPEWITDAIYEAHDGEAPNDWRYDQCDSLADAICDALDNDDRPDRLDTHEMVDGLVDIYNTSLAQWLADNPSRAHYCDEYAAEYGDQLTEVFAFLQGGQHLAVRRMADTLMHAIQAEAAGIEEEQDADALADGGEG